METCFIYTAFVLITTTVITYIGREWPFETLGSICMFLPAVFSPWFATKDFIQQIIGYEQRYVALQYSVTGGMLVIITLVGVTGLVTVTRWGEVDTTPKPSKPETLHEIVAGYLRVVGEEIGWRCFLLPCLLQSYSNFWALFISGIIWGAYHMPVMVLLTMRIKPKNAVLTVLVQSLSCFLSAYLHGWVAIKSGFSLWAPSVMHFTWNRLNPAVFGCIYTQEDGRVKGQQWLINGEGLAGCIVMLPIAAMLMYNLGF